MRWVVGLLVCQCMCVGGQCGRLCVQGWDNSLGCLLEYCGICSVGYAWWKDSWLS